MAYNYDLTATGTTLLVSKVRLEIGDEVENSGVKPNNANFTDAEIEYMLDEEGSDVMRAAAHALEVLSRAFARLASLAVGPQHESLSDISKAYAERAAELRTQYGGVATFATAGFIRVDGYSDDIASDDVEVVSEYGLAFEYVVPERGM